MRGLGLLAFAGGQRAKFEGWLKFELAACAAGHGATGVSLEAPYSDSCRCDLAFHFEGRRVMMELKTANTNWRIDGVESSTRPITENIAGVVRDGMKLRGCGRWV